MIKKEILSQLKKFSKYELLRMMDLAHRRMKAEGVENYSIEDQKLNKKIMDIGENDL